MEEVLNGLGYLSLAELIQLQALIAAMIKNKKEIKALAAKLDAAR